ncbi:MAG: hypothetical protein HY017_33350 [Betaproteobacteria bacterium]|nr:hypothetical protein [Betaproteobacteria bacterium]
MGRDLTEHFPLSGWDEYPIHQFPEPIRFVATTDLRAFERYWFTAQDELGELFLVTGIGFYPNLGTADAYAILVQNNVHTTVRAHRPLGSDRGDFTVGPLCFELIEPFTEWRLSLGENAQRLAFDLTWRDAKRAVFRRQPVRHGAADWRLLHEWAGYETFGTIDGTVQYKGKQFQLRRSNVRGSRDHHWGIRNGVGGPGQMLREPGDSHLGQWVEFGDWSIWSRQVLFNLGDGRRGASRIEPFEHRMRFDPVTKNLTGGFIRNRLDNGEIREVAYEQIANQVAYLRCGMYTGPNDRGTPEENYHHGMAVGNCVGGETYDLTDPNVRIRIAGFEDHLCRATWNGETVVGILECRNPALYEMCRDGAPGFSILEDQ